jgi:hypothetical protein
MVRGFRLSPVSVYRGYFEYSTGWGGKRITRHGMCNNNEVGYWGVQMLLYRREEEEKDSPDIKKPTPNTVTMRDGYIKELFLTTGINV